MFRRGPWPGHLERDRTVVRWCSDVRHLTSTDGPAPAPLPPGWVPRLSPAEVHTLRIRRLGVRVPSGALDFCGSDLRTRISDPFCCPDCVDDGCHVGAMWGPRCEGA